MEFLFPSRSKKVNQGDLRYQIKDDSVYGPNSKLKFKGRITNRRTPLPNELFTFFHLQVLDLSNKHAEFGLCVLDIIPVELFRLRNLKVLNMEYHNIKKVPAEVASMNKLEVLTLTRNKISKLPCSFSSLVSLKYLHISHNCIQTFPDVICSLKSLTFLDISFNKIQSIPNEIHFLADELGALLITDNKLECLPKAICKCVNLMTLWLANNSIRRLPDQFYKLNKLDWNKSTPLAVNCLSGNHIQYPPYERVCSLGLDAIFKYLIENADKESDTEVELRGPTVSVVGYEYENNMSVSIQNDPRNFQFDIRIPTIIIDDLDDETQ